MQPRCTIPRTCLVGNVFRNIFVLCLIYLAHQILCRPRHCPDIKILQPGGCVCNARYGDLELLLDNDWVAKFLSACHS